MATDFDFAQKYSDKDRYGISLPGLEHPAASSETRTEYDTRWNNRLLLNMFW
jgi:hypothetical protein